MHEKTDGTETEVIGDSGEDADDDGEVAFDPMTGEDQASFAEMLTTLILGIFAATILGVVVPVIESMSVLLRAMADILLLPFSTPDMMAGLTPGDIIMFIIAIHAVGFILRAVNVALGSIEVEEDPEYPTVERVKEAWIDGEYDDIVEYEDDLEEAWERDME